MKTILGLDLGITAAIILSKSPICSVNNNAYYSQLYIESILEQPKQTLFRS